MKKIYISLCLTIISFCGFSQWFPLTSGTTNPLISVRFFDTNNGYVADYSGQGIYKTTNGGINWNNIGGVLERPFFVDTFIGYAVGTGGLIKKTTDGGQSWVLQTSGTTVDLKVVYFSDINNGYVAGYIFREFPQLTSQIIIKTTNGGANWIEVYNGNGSCDEIYSIFFTEPNNVYAIGGSLNGGCTSPHKYYAKTTNGGLNWVHSIEGGEYPLLSVYFPDTNNGYAVGYLGNMRKTTNAGNSWSIMNSGVSQSLYSVFFTNTLTGYAVGDGGTILKTSNGGINWYVQPSGITSCLYSIYFEDEFTGYAVGCNGTILKTTNGGISFPRQPVTPTGPTLLCINSPNSIYTTSGAVEATSYIWEINPSNAGIISGTGLTGSVDWNDTYVGTAQITVKGHNSLGDGPVSNPCIVNIEDFPGNAGSISGPTIICQGQSNIIYTVPTIANASSYIWTLPIGAIGTSNTNSIIVSFGNNVLPGDMTVKGHSACGDGVPSTLSINVALAPENAGVIIGSNSVCQGQNGVTYTVPPIANATSYVWYLPVGASGSSNTNSITIDYGALASSSYIVVNGHNTICGDGGMSALFIVVNDIPPTPTITQNILVLSSDAPAGNQWYRNNSLISGATGQSYACTQNGNYTDIVTMNGCSSGASNIINVIEVGMDKTENNKRFTIYPNPVTDELIIEISGNKEKINFEILNSTGQLVYKGKMVEKTIVKTKDFAAGVYMIKFENGNKMEFRKMLKE